MLAKCCDMFMQSLLNETIFQAYKIITEVNQAGKNS
jgi:hypothetical protein